MTKEPIQPDYNDETSNDLAYLWKKLQPPMPDYPITDTTINHKGDADNDILEGGRGGV